MIAKSRRIPVHDFLLVLLSAAVLTLLLWPAGTAIREVEVRHIDGTLQTYQLAAHDPTLAKIAEKLKRWSDPKPNSQIAINRWNAELGNFYAQRTTPQAANEIKRILPVSYYPDHAKKQEAAAQEAANMKQQQAYWLDFQRQAERTVQTEQQRRQRLLALHVSPPISVGELQPGPYPPKAIIYSTIIGFCVAVLFSTWHFLAPSIQLVKQTPSPSVAIKGRQTKESHLQPHQTDRSVTGATANSMQFEVTLPAAWVKVHQPIGVWMRQAAYLALLTSVVLVTSTSILNPDSQWRGFPARVLWGEYNSGSVSPLPAQSNQATPQMQRRAFAPRTS